MGEDNKIEQAMNSTKEITAVLDRLERAENALAVAGRELQRAELHFEAAMRERDAAAAAAQRLKGKP